MSATANTYPQILLSGLQASYDALETKDANKLYFCTDTGKVYKGTVDFTNSVVYAATKPASPITGKVYVIAETDTVEAYIGGSWKVLSYPVSASSNEATTISNVSTDVQVATAKNVYLAIEAAKAEITGGTNVVKNVAAKTGEGSDGKIVVTKGDDSTADVTVPGVVTTPTWNSTTRVLSLPVTGQANPIEVNIGKDIFIDPTAQNGYDPDTGDIVIYLNDGTESKDPTEIRIPAGELLTIYNGHESDTVNLVIRTAQDPQTHKEQYYLDAEVKISSASGNIISVDQTNGGIFASVDLTPYVTNTDFQSYQSTMSTTINGLDTRITANNTAIGVLNGDSTTAGSVDYKVAAAQGTLQTAINGLDTRLTTAEGDIDQLEADVAALATAATTWGSF
jgi:hypothetical protein